MASLRDIRKRIKSVKSSQKITKAMKLVAASKLKRAQDAIVQARPYAQEIATVLSRVAAQVGASGTGEVHPLLASREPRKVLLLVITSDRGLCGAFNANVLRRADRFIRENTGRFEHVEVAAVGRKGREFFAKKGSVPVRDLGVVGSAWSYAQAVSVASALSAEFTAGSLDAVFVVYNEFKSAISQRVVVQDLLPVVQADLPESALTEYVYEPSAEQVLDRLVPRYVATGLWRALLESAASEHGARMSAMDSATKNASELIAGLTLVYNRVRQAAITRELMEIIGGAEALKG
jgi:F-type H+-transporting ATPase subunit gamma